MEITYYRLIMNLHRCQREPRVLIMLVDTSIQKGKADEATRQNFASPVRNLACKIIEGTNTAGGDEVVSLDVEDANVLYVALAGKHSIIPVAAIMNASKEKWSLSYYAAVNFGAFVGNPKKTQEISQRIINEARRLKVNALSICVCGIVFE